MLSLIDASRNADKNMASKNTHRPPENIPRNDLTAPPTQAPFRLEPIDYFCLSSAMNLPQPTRSRRLNDTQEL